MLDLEEDLCGFFNGYTGSKVIALFADQWKQYGNFGKPCPLEVWKIIDNESQRAYI